MPSSRSSSSQAVIPMWLPLCCDQCRRYGRWVLRQLPSQVAVVPQLQQLHYVMTLLPALLPLAPTTNIIQFCNFLRRYSEWSLTSHSTHKLHHFGDCCPGNRLQRHKQKMMEMNMLVAPICDECKGKIILAAFFLISTSASLIVDPVPRFCLIQTQCTGVGKSS